MINWREVPLVRIVLALITGVLSANTGLGFLFFAILFLFLSISAASWLSRKSIAFRYRWIFGISMVVFWFCVGYICFRLNTESSYENHFCHFLTGEQVITGIADEAPKDGPFIKFTMQVSAIGGKSASIKPCFGRLLVYLKKDSLDQRIVHYGDKISILGNILPVPAALNPDAFDYRKYLFYKNTGHQVFVKSDCWVLAGANEGNSIWSFAYRCRNHCIRIIAKYLGNENEYAVASALLFGYDDAISNEVKMAYIQTGSMHILAVSGMHVGLIYLLLAQVFKRIKLRNTWWVFFEIIVSLTTVWGFTLLTGASASVLRAATMFSFMIIGIKFKRFVNIYNTLAASVLCLLLWDPFLLFDIGFQLSYAAVVGIVYFQQKIYKLLVFSNIILDYIWQLSSVSFAAQLGALPLSLYYFHAFPTWFWLSGLVAIPVSSLALYAGIVMLILESVIPVAAGWAGIVFYWLIWLMNECIFIVQRFPLSIIQGIWLSGLETMLILLILLILAIVIQTGNVRGIALCGVCIGAFVFSTGFKGTKQYFQGELTIYYINRHTLIDWTDGFDVYSFSAADLSQTKENQAAQLHRWSNRVASITHLDLDTIRTVGSGFHFANHIITFRNQTLAIVDSITEPSNDSVILIDYLLICGNSKMTIETILKTYRPLMILADGSNSSNKVNQWKKEAAYWQIPFYDLSEAGAFVKKFD